MNEEQKRRLMRFWILPVLAAVGGYFAVACAAAKVLKIPSPEFFSVLKMFPSWVADCLDISFFIVDLPQEYAADIQAKTGLSDCALSSYHLFADGLRGGWIYSLFPYFFLVVVVGFGVLAACKLGSMSPEESTKKQKYLRGTRKVSSDVFVHKSQLIRDIATGIRTKSGMLMISDKKLREHTLILGATGSGKSQLILNYMRDILKGGIRCIAVDRKGEFWAHFGRQGKDFLFHPFDERGVKWSIFDEINVEIDKFGKVSKMPDDVAAITSILFQLTSRKGDDKFWYEAAASVANSAICYCIMHGKTTTQELLQVVHTPAPQLAEMLSSLPPALAEGVAAMGDPKGKQAGSVLSICAATLKCLAPFATSDGSADRWSCRDWINNGKGNLFISCAGKNDEIFVGVVGLVIDLIGREMKQFADDGQHKTKFLFVLDELGSYPPLTTLIWLLTLGRSKGVGVIVANQTVSKIKKVYGEQEARNLISNMKTKYIYMLPEPGDAEYASKMIGAAEVERTTKSENRGAGLLGKAHSDSDNTGKQIMQDSPFLPADIQNLGTGEAITIEPNLLPMVAKIQYLPVTDCPARQAEYMPKPTYEISAAAAGKMIQQQAQEQQAEGGGIAPTPATAEAEQEQKGQVLTHQDDGAEENSSQEPVGATKNEARDKSITQETESLQTGAQAQETANDGFNAF